MPYHLSAVTQAVALAALRHAPELLGRVDDLRAEPPTAYGDLAVTGVEQPADDVLVHRLSGGRVVVRPSGTEPKLKVYLEAVVPVEGEDGLPAAREEATRRLAEVRAAMEELTRV